MADPILIHGLPQLERNLTSLERQVFPRAATRAVNRTATTVRTRNGSSIAKEMGAKVSSVKSRMAIDKARVGGQPHAAIRIKGKPLNAVEFNARQTKKGVSAAPWANRQVFEGAFIGVMRNGNRLVMKRRRIGGARVARLPLDPVFGPGVAQTAATDEMAEERAMIVAEEMPKRLEHELRYAVERLKR